MYKILFGNPEGKRPLYIYSLRWEGSMKSLGKYGEKVLTGFAWLRIETGGGLL
jgi:hypothetical protein